MRVFLVFLLVAVIFGMGCTGKQGPTGPAGSQGEQGPAGELGVPGQDGQDGQDGEDGAGTRIIYQSTGPIGTSGLVYFVVPEITLDDLPLVAVYAAWSAAPTAWFELPLYVPDVAHDNTQMYYLEEGKVFLENCFNLWIKIVIVI